jgi:hypothetical protein
METTRAEHLQWCKDRAIEILNRTGDCGEAYASFTSDMNKHHETRNHSALMLGMMLMLGGHNQTPDAMEKFINGFN